MMTSESKKAAGRPAGRKPIRFLPVAPLPENLPEAVLRWEYEKSPAGCPMPEDAPDNLAAVQLLRLKAKVSAKLHLHTEVRTIHARLGNKYQHIEELIKNIQP